MRIGFDAKRAFHNSRGLGNYARNLIEGLGKFYPEHQYFLYTPRCSGSPVRNWPVPSQVLIREPGRFFRWFPQLWRSFYLPREFVTDNVDIYHGLSHELPLGIEKSGVRSIVTIHDLIAFRFPHLFPRFDRNVYVKKTTHACQKADLILAICEQTKRDIQEYLGVSTEKIKVLYQSIHSRFYHPPEKESVEKMLSRWGITLPYILFVGALEERKNVLALVQAYANIVHKKDVGLVLVGQGGEYRKRVEDLIRKLGLGEKVKILSRVGTEELPCLYAGSILFCYPSFFEGFGLPIAEALFCNKPVITSQGSCFPEAGGPGSVYIDPHSVDDLSHALETVLNDSEKQSEMIRTGRIHVEKFHWEKTTENLIRVYRDMAGK